MNLSRQRFDEAWWQRPVHAGILVGGASTRMGQPKSSLRLAGETFAQRIVATVQNHVQRVVLLGDNPVPSVPSQVTQLSDVPGLAGPLAGMLAALRWAPKACWVFVACDLVMLRAEALDWLLSQRQPGRWAVLPKLDGGQVEPLLAVYEPEALELLEQLVARGLRSPHRLADEPQIYTPTPPAALQACWTNINTPEEFRRFLRGADKPPP